MATFPQLTIPLKARGRFKVREPFRISETIDYTVIAIRSFKDLYREGTNPYTTIYVPVGLVDGVVFDDHTFSFAEEEIRGINIVTLTDDAGRSILVPDNYITAYPSSTSIAYLEFILSCSLGPLPQNIDTTSAVAAVTQAVLKEFGVTSTVQIHTLPTLTNPTYDEHLALEQARIGAIDASGSTAEQLRKYQQDILDRDGIIAALTQILIDNNLMPTN